MKIVPLEGRLQELLDSIETNKNKDEMYEYYIR